MTKKKRPGPKPVNISLHPFTFDDVLDAVLASKTKKPTKERNENAPEVTNVSKSRKSA
ncbi:MAG: hypothetical protein ACLP5H_07785 [Desulfomonilaceae bacterium]